MARTNPTKNVFNPIAAAILAGTAFLLSAGPWALQAEAALCPKCSDLLFVDSAGKCSVCGSPTSSAALQLCPKCSARLHKCEHCGEPIDTPAASSSSSHTPPDVPSASQATDSSVPVDTSALPSPAPSTSPAPTTGPSNLLPTSSPEPPMMPQPIAAQPLAPQAASSPPPLPLEPVPIQSSPAQPAPLQQIPSPATANPRLPYPALPGAPPRIVPIDPRRPGVYEAGRWRYELQIKNPGMANEGRFGWLMYDNQKLPRGEINDYYSTPWGPIYWADVSKTTSGLHGWMPYPLQNTRRGRAMVIPAALLVARSGAASIAPPAGAQAPPAAPPRPQTLELNRTHNGQVAHVHVGNQIIVRLPGNPASGYQWQAIVPRTSNVPLAARPQFVAPTQPGVPGTYIFVFQPTQAGAGSIRVQYARPGDATRPPAEVYMVSVQVQALSR